MTTKRHQVLVVGLDRRLVAAGREVSVRMACPCLRSVTPHQALRTLAVDDAVEWTVLTAGVLVGLDPVAFVAAARDLLGPEARIIVAGIDPGSPQGARLRTNGATACVERPHHLHHPCLSLGLVA